MNEQRVINTHTTERSNSFTARHSGPGTEFKVYFDTPTQLTEGLKAIAGAVRLWRTLTEDLKAELKENED